MQFAIEPWDPDYGPRFSSDELETSDAAVDASVELAPARWQALSPGAPLMQTIVFVDGVRRIDARVWMTDEAAIYSGVCASYAAGTVETGSGTAEIRDLVVRRGLFTDAPAPDLKTAAGDFNVVHAATEGAIQEVVRELETEVAARLAHGNRLIIVDGPLSAHHTTKATLGYVKTHRVRYLGEDLTRTVHALRPGERSPLFLTTTSWSRYSSYLRLPGAITHPWAGIVRLEVAAAARLAEAKVLVDTATSLLPRYASIPFKDPRAPQNLYPIGGLERHLRHRLGDRALVHRALRQAVVRMG